MAARAGTGRGTGRGKAVLLTQQKGGAGKTTLLTALAAEFARAGAAVTVVDLDPQRSTAAWHAERCRRFGNGHGVHLAESAEWRARSDIQDAATRADWVFVDAPGSADTLGKAAMRAADFALIPCQPSMADVWATGATLKLLAEARLGHAIALNRVPPRGRVAEIAAARLAELGAPVLEPRLGSRTAFAEAFMTGRGPGELARPGRAGVEIAALAAALAAALGLPAAPLADVDAGLPTGGARNGRAAEAAENRV
ncbi:MAG: ParA family protein [Pseudomonadota bacterium]